MIEVRPVLACLLCGAAGKILYAQMQDRIYHVPGAWALRECEECGLTWLDPRPLPDSIPQLYAQYYPAAAATDAQPSTVRSSLRRLVLHDLGYPTAPKEAGVLLRLAARTAFVKDIVAADVMFLPATQAGVVLDIGCGSGTVLAALQELGWSVRGIEPDPACAREALRLLHGTVEIGSAERVELGTGIYDAIIMNHVVEHLYDPATVLSKCARALKPGGKLVITTPNARSFGRRLFGRSWLHWDSPRHLFIFDAPSLVRLIEAAGLSVLERRTMARKGRWSWIASMLIREGGRPTSNSVRTAKTRRYAALLFQLAEHAAARVAAVGEELLVIATTRAAVASPGTNAD